MIETGDHHLASKIMEQPCICESSTIHGKNSNATAALKNGKKTVGIAGRGIPMTFEKPMQNFQAIYAQKMRANEQNLQNYYSAEVGAAGVPSSHKSVCDLLGPTAVEADH